jgi:serine protease AprX
MKRSNYSFRLRGCVAFAFVAVLLASTTAAAQGRSPAKLDTILRERATQLTGRSRVIVEFTAAPDVRVFARGGGGRRVGTQAQVGEIDNYSLVTLAADPRVARVMIDRPAFPTMDRTAGAVGATLVREDFGVDGNGVGVAIVDSGITSYHDDLYLSKNRRSGRVVHFKDFTRVMSKNLWATEVPRDEYGHGTHVAGIIAGNGFDSKGTRAGIAPGAHLIGLKVLDADGHGYISDVIAAIDYAISIRTRFNIRVLNLSVASAVIESYNADPLTLAARRAAEAGIVVVAAAGNLGRNAADQAQFGGVTSPGNAPWVLTVGASTHQGTARRADDAVAAFSSRGPTWIDFAAKPDLVAPGVGIESLSDPHSTLYATYPDYLLPGAVSTWYKPYLSLTGTSMAAPVVTGTIALMMQANPALTPNAVKAILQYTAQARAGEHILAQGAGMLNARGAVRLAAYFAAPRQGIGEMADSIAGEEIAWARHIIWGNYRVVGGVPLPGTPSTAWALSVPWGALKTPAGTPVVWGANTDENIVWSTSTDENIVWSTSTDENIVWSTAGTDENIVWSTAPAAADENIVWSTAAGDDENIVWSTALVRNVVWGHDCGGRNCRNVIWGARSGDRVWGTTAGDENIVWSTAIDDDENIVWSTADDHNIVWSTTRRNENIVWSTVTMGQVVWPASSR